MKWFRADFDSKQAVLVEAADKAAATQLVTERYIPYRGWDADAITVDIRLATVAQTYGRARDELHTDTEPFCAIVQSSEANGVTLLEKRASQAGGSIYEYQLPQSNA